MWYFLATSLAVLTINKPLAYILLGFTVILGWFNQTLATTAIILMIFIAATWFALRNAVERYSGLRYIMEAFYVLIALMLVMHLLPGFHNLKVLDTVPVGPQSAPFTMYYNFDKAIVPFVLMACTGKLFVTESPCKTGILGWGILILSVPALLMLAVVLGGLRYEPHLPEWLPQFALANIFFVSLAEEALFRGYLQQRLSQVVHPLAALIITAFAFGIMHYAGGLLLVIFAALSGIIYGLAWMWSGKLWVAVLFHFMLNCVHLLFFTYPFYSPTAGA